MGGAECVMGNDEAAIERYFVEQVKLAGGESFKFTSLGMRGVPDRIAIFRFNRTFFVEMKQKRGRLREHQKLWHDLVWELGVQVECLWSKQQVDDFIRRVK